MEFCTISSGSKGNMTYVASGNDAFLIDAGISLPSAVLRAPEGVDFTKVRAILVTHEHADHIAFLGTVARKLDVPVWIHRSSFECLPIKTRVQLAGRPVCFLEGKKTYELSSFKIATLPLYHDSASILGFYISDGAKRLAYAADTGVFPEAYIPLFKEADDVMIEANHDVAILQDSNRDYYVKQRALSALGHLSNDACLDVLKRILSPRLKSVTLMHISEECNSDQALKDDIITPFSREFKGTTYIARQDRALPLLEA